MREIDAPRRFFIRERAGTGSDQRRWWEVVDRTGFMEPTKFPAPNAVELVKAQERATAVAKARNECELAGEHVWEINGSGCAVCDATCDPEREYER